MEQQPLGSSAPPLILFTYTRMIRRASLHVVGSLPSAMSTASVEPSRSTVLQAFTSFWLVEDWPVAAEVAVASARAKHATAPAKAIETVRGSVTARCSQAF